MIEPCHKCKVKRVVQPFQYFFNKKWYYVLLCSSCSCDKYIRVGGGMKRLIEMREDDYLKFISPKERSRRAKRTKNPNIEELFQ